MSGRLVEPDPGSQAEPGHALRSGELASIAGTTQRALRHYHRLGLLPEPPRDPNGYRRYEVGHLVRLLRIRQLASSGMPLRDIGHVLELDAGRRDDALDELDRALAADAARIAEQRRVLATMRRSTPLLDVRLTGEEPSVTRHLDEDLWTLLTATGSIAPEAAAAMAEIVGTPALHVRMDDLVRGFDALEGVQQVDGATVERIASSMVSIADEVIASLAVPSTPVDVRVVEMVETLRTSTLSRAQAAVWARFEQLMASPRSEP